MHFQNSNFKRTAKILQKLVYEIFYVHEKILHTGNSRHKFIKTLLPEKCKKKHVNQTTAI